MALSSNARRSLVLAFVALVGAVVAVSGSTDFGCARGQTESAQPPRRLPPPPASSAELALLAPVAPGAKFEGWRVSGVTAVHEGAIRIELERGAEHARLSVHATGGGPPPPATAGRYAIYYSARDSAEGTKLAQALARILDERADRPLPPGLAAFREETRGER